MRRRDEFLAMLSHELRNPLAAIYSATLILARQDLGAEFGCLVDLPSVRLTPRPTLRRPCLESVTRGAYPGRRA